MRGFDHPQFSNCARRSSVSMGKPSHKIIYSLCAVYRTQFEFRTPPSEENSRPTPDFRFFCRVDGAPWSERKQNFHIVTNQVWTGVTCAHLIKLIYINIKNVYALRLFGSRHGGALNPLRCMYARDVPENKIIPGKLPHGAY